MENIKDTQFTWGFEIEGLISQKLKRELRTEAETKKYEFDFKEDGSVDVGTAGLPITHFGYFTENYDDDNGDEQEDEHLITETNAGVFQSLDEMLEVLKMFENNKNYFQNDTCGLHIHIKPKDEFKHLKYELFNSKFIELIQRYAETGLCKCIKDRITAGHWCYAFYRTDRLLTAYKSNEKYVFMGNHPQGTIEFRFFSACKEKEKNVRDFFNVFFGEFAKVGKELSKRYFFLDDINYQQTTDYFDIKQNKTLRLEV